MEGLVSYMKHAKALVASHYSQKSNIPLNITLGNVSGDADSTIGAVLLGYAMTHKNGFYPQEEEKLHENASKFYVPIVNFKREELRCRQDIEWHCEQRGFDKDLFIFFDEIDLGYYCEKELLNTTLFDHNSLDINEAYLGSSVKAIVDHHVDKGSPACLHPARQIA